MSVWVLTSRQFEVIFYQWIWVLTSRQFYVIFYACPSSYQQAVWGHILSVSEYSPAGSLRSYFISVRVLTSRQFVGIFHQWIWVLTSRQFEVIFFVEEVAAGSGDTDEKRGDLTQQQSTPDGPAAEGGVRREDMAKSCQIRIKWQNHNI